MQVSETRISYAENVSADLSSLSEAEARRLTDELKATVTTANTAEPKVQAEDTQLKKDMAYIAYLWKTGLFDFRKRQELSEHYDIDAINALFNQYNKDELEAMSKGHSKSLRKYSLD